MSIIDDLLERGVGFIPGEGLIEEAARVLALAQGVLSGLSACPPLEKRTMFPEALSSVPGASRKVIQCFLTREPDISSPEPAEVTAVRKEMKSLRVRVADVAEEILFHLGQECDLLFPMMEDLLAPQEWVLNAVHYPYSGEAGRLLFPAHRDWGTLAIYPLIEGSGLEMSIAGGEWAPVEAPPGHMLCYAGDILGRVTDGLVKPLLHRVRQPVAWAGSDQPQLAKCRS
jgi:isopenicillin N synthase-like dioxygenase